MRVCSGEAYFKDGVQVLASDLRSSGHDSTGKQQGERQREYVDVIVSYAAATNDVHIRFADYDAQYQELLVAMAAHYNSVEARAPWILEQGQLYATLHEGRWLRVRTLGQCDGDEVECQFVDEGHKSFVSPHALVELESCFAELPTQAVKWRLALPVGCARCKSAGEVLSDELLGKTLLAGFIGREDPVNAVLLDVSGAEDVNLNAVVFERLMTPRFPPKRRMGRCLVSHIGNDGLLGIQMKCPSLNLLGKLMWHVNRRCRYGPGIAAVPTMSTLYACRFRVGGVFRRAELISPVSLPSGEFQVRYVDYGDEGTAFLSKFRSLDGFKQPVSCLPYQALYCRLHGLTEEDGFSWSEEASSLLRKLISTRGKLFLTVTRPADDEHVARIKLFRRRRRGRDLVSLNGALARDLRR